MIVDVHTHLPNYKEAVPAGVRESNTKWRPDRPVEIPVSWDDYLTAQKPADVSIVFHIARMDEEQYPDHSWYSGNLNDATATFVAAYPERLIGFMSLHPQAPGCLEELQRVSIDLAAAVLNNAPYFAAHKTFSFSCSSATSLRATTLGTPSRIWARSRAGG